MPTHRLGLLREVAEVTLCSLPPNQLNLRLAPSCLHAARLLAAGFLAIIGLFVFARSLNVAFGPHAVILFRKSGPLRLGNSSSIEPTQKCCFMNTEQIRYLLSRIYPLAHTC